MTLLELMIALVIVATVAMMALGAFNSQMSFGFNGVVETRCIDGYQFIIGHEGQARQIMNEFGKGKRC